LRKLGYKRQPTALKIKKGRGKKINTTGEKASQYART
jgi:hypothetical protein